MASRTRPARLLIQFAKAPAHKTVKTRLAQALGPAEALRLHRRLSARTWRQIRGRGRWATQLAVTPDHRASGARRWAGTHAVAQGPGDLGRRMMRALSRGQKRGQKRGQHSVLVGSDIPGLSAAAVQRAFHALRSHDLVFGPALDGGYWLIGARSGRAAQVTLAPVRWSTPDALTDSLACVPGHWRVALVDRLQDLDTPSDYARWRRSAKDPL